MRIFLTVIGSVVLLYGLFCFLRFLAFGVWDLAYDRGYFVGSLILMLIGAGVLFFNYKRSRKN